VRETKETEQHQKEHPTSHQESIFNTQVSRREVLLMAGAGGLGLLLGSAGMAGILSVKSGLASPTQSAGPLQTVGSRQDTVPFYGPHQAGITTPMQDFMYFVSFDLTTDRLTEVRDLFRAWTDAAAKLCGGQPVGKESGNPYLPPVDTGEAAGLSASNTTITFGVGPTFFDGRFGLSGKRPEALVDLPFFPGEQLQPEWCGGDLCVQVCSNDPQVAFHAARNLIRIARGIAVIRWAQEGFQRTGRADPTNSTPRNLMGFKDGTVNPDIHSRDQMNKVVWAQPQDGPAWMQNGTYIVIRRIRMRIEVWDRSTLLDQEQTFGRHRDSGAPLGGQNEFDPLDLDKREPDGKPVIPANAHVRLAHGDGRVQILRRSYSYSNHIDPRTGELDAGLFFLCFQRDPRRQFIPIQERLAKQDALNEYIVHVGSAIFACLPGVRQGGYIGDTLL
jgi:deferrochelatase/peroxidase EfeB